ncbi:MAG: TRAP transporter small permease subunit [Burkholderiaceae bacterium]|nr:TRAP transporter small permease subunit [Burkholderiaceae bacterium]
MLLRLADQIDVGVRRIGRVFSWLVFAIILLMAVNVILRYSLSLGSVWAQELEWHLLVPLILLVMSWGVQSGDIARIDVYYADFSPAKKLMVDLLASGLTAMVCLLVIWFSLGYVEQSFSIMEQSPDPGGIPYRWVIKAFIPLGFFILLLQSAASFVRDIHRLRSLGGQP